jgi:dienelactone hydrolase
MIHTTRLVLCAILVAATPLLAQRPDRPIKPIPPPGVEVPERVQAGLEAGLARLEASIAKLGGNELLPDVLIYRQAVRYALDYNEFFNEGQFGDARRLLQEGQQRADQLLRGQAPWTTATGLVVRGYISKIDGSPQPYGLVIPESYSPAAPRRWRLDAWFHGRGETLNEIAFITGRENDPGQFTPRDTIVIHLYGRYCNANKFAGEVDLFEAMDDVKRQYPIDENRILMRGFSMGGASAWQFGTHFAGMWAAVAPGAGFSESAEFLHLNLDGPDAPPVWEQKLYGMYDSTLYAVNLSNTSTVAYNGDQDGQKQAADAMERYLAKDGMRLTRVWGKDAGHRYTPEAIDEINEKIDAIAERGRDPYPTKIRFTTYTLKYNQMKWVTIDALGQHWERASLDTEITGPSAVKVDTQNVTAFTFDVGSGGSPLDLTSEVAVTIDGQTVSVPGPMTDRSWNIHFRKSGANWAAIDSATVTGLHKKHDLQGPVDDAFMDSFIMVTPTGTPAAPGVASWVESEQNRAIAEWRKQFRGDAQVRADSEITDADIAGSNLVLWGDPGSNAILARIADRLPIKWDATSVTVGSQTYSAKTHAPILIFPNPLNPEKYVVLNSGFTFREFDYLNNARQVPKLPDYAIVDTATPPGPRYPGKIITAGFFNEDWGL